MHNGRGLSLLLGRALGAGWCLFGLVVLVSGLQDATRGADVSQHAARLVVAAFGGVAVVAGLARLLAWRAGPTLLTLAAVLLLLYGVSLFHLEGTAAQMDGLKAIAFAFVTVTATWILRKWERRARTAPPGEGRSQDETGPPKSNQ